MDERDIMFGYIYKLNSKWVLYHLSKQRYFFLTIVRQKSKNIYYCFNKRTISMYFFKVLLNRGTLPTLHVPENLTNWRPRLSLVHGVPNDKSA
jgi:hypothetical protein